MLQNGHDPVSLESVASEGAAEKACFPESDATAAAGPANSESMAVDECAPAAIDLFKVAVLRTPAKSNGANAASSLSEEILGATPGRHTDPEFKCVYPPSEDAQSLIVEHFGFLPISFIDEIINAANDTIYRATDALSKFVEKEQGSSEATSQAINKAETLLEHAVDKNFDKFELYALRNLFNIPRGLEDYVVMPHRRADISNGPAVFAVDEAELDKELEAVRRQLVANNLLKTKLQRDTAKVERCVRRLRALNEQLHISEIAQKTLVDPVPVVAADMRDQVGELTRLVDQLEMVTESGSLASLDALSDPAARDIYLARIAGIQVADRESQQARLRPGEQETNETRGLDSQGLLQLQTERTGEQDLVVTEFSALLRRQRAMGETIGSELDLQNQLLTQLDQDVDHTSNKLAAARRQANKL